MREGVIKFSLAHREAAIAPQAELEQLVKLRPALIDRRLIGQAPERYDGVGYGNVSVRSGDGFLVSGTQTSGLRTVEPREHFAHVTSWDHTQNKLVSEGPVRPSSESMTHAMIYEAAPGCRCVLHVHSPEIWNAWQRLSLDVTRQDIQYGTPEMAEAVRLLAKRSVTKAVAMLGHEDGVIVWGQGVDAAFERLLQLWSSAD